MHQILLSRYLEELKQRMWGRDLSWEGPIRSCWFTQAGVHQMLASWMSRETFLLEFLISNSRAFSGWYQDFTFRNPSHSVPRWDSESCPHFFPRGRLCSVRQFHPLHTDRLDLPQTWDIAVLTRLTYVNIFWIFNYFQHRGHIIRKPLPVILHLLPLQTAWGNEFFCHRGHRRKLRPFFFF